ncbi:MAG: TonB-dependent receptor [Pseudomonadota bacterium]|nr:TonB-dependent receptor [Pseudomonadota bacterium]
MTRTLAFILSTSAFATQAIAQRQPDQPVAPAPADPDGVHDESASEIVVTGHLTRDLDLLAGKSVLDESALQREVRPQIGDTLAKLPGVSATSFSPGASRPVLRGFSGERVRVLTDGIGSIDVSNTSSDHAVTIDPLTAERIEVLRGPAVLLFGGQAIGGAVNVIDRRIPRTVPKKGYHVDVIGALGSAANERSIGGAGDLALGDSGFVLHVDGSYRKTGDLRVGGFILSPALRDEQREIAEEELEEGHPEEAAEALELANRRGKIPNSAVEQTTAGLGLAYIRGPLSVGASFSIFDSDYGVPSRPGAGHHDEEDGGEEDEAGDEHGEVPVSISLRQKRFDLRGDYEFGSGFFERARLRAGTADYTHTEFEGDEVGTVFDSKGSEGRVELVQRDSNGWHGASGVQYSTRKFDAVGAEAFLRENRTRQFGIFTLQELHIGKLGLEGALRYDRSNVDSDFLGIERSFDAVSGAVGASYELAPQTRAGVNLSRTARAPSAEELFSDGPHIATQAFEIGNPDLTEETSLGGEAYLRLDRRDYSLGLTVFANRFNNFIFEADTGEEEDELPVFRYFQRDATYTGFEVEGSATLFRAGGFRFVGDVVADYVRASIKGAGPVPRIPPLRVLGGLEAQSAKIDGRVEVEWSDDQLRTASFETPTDGHTLVNASIAWRPWGRSKEMQLMLAASNIFDVDVRRHASFTKDYVPLAGRDIRLSARLDF